MTAPLTPSDRREELAREIRSALGKFNNEHDSVIGLVMKLAAELEEANRLLAKAQEGNQIWRDRRDAALTAQEAAERKLARYRAKYGELE